MSLETNGWISNKPARIDSRLIPVFERYLLGSLATGCSKMGWELIGPLKLKNSTIASAYLSQLESNGPKPNFASTAYEVENFISKRDCKPWEGSEYFICTRSSSDKIIDAIKQLPEYKETANSKASIEGTPIIIRRFDEVDSVYRHIRNALAHGCFRYPLNENSEQIYMFDINQNNCVSFSSIISLNTLDDWYEIACRFAGQKL